jgi:hypothetical protein
MPTIAKRRKIMRLIREAASSGRLGSWMTIEAEMRAAGHIDRHYNPIDDAFLRAELDFLCRAAKKKNQIV